MITPPPLHPGSTIAILSPASTVKSEYVEGARSFLQSRGFRVKLMPAVLGPASGSYASAMQARLHDLQDALLDDEVGAILCARGGYGAVHLLEHLPTSLITSHPKWLIGFSDISALHALWQKAGLVSLHAPMAKHLATAPAGDESTEALLSIITGASEVSYTTAPHPLDLPGEATGILRGGNLAVLSHLIATPWDTLTPAEGEQVILFIEDIGEAIYATERMLWQLKGAGILSRVTGIIAGQFTQARADLNYPSTTAMIGARLRQWGISCPVAACFPAGHVDRNLPLPLGARATLSVTPGAITLTARL